MRIKPAGHFVLVELTKAEEISEGGIVLPKDLTKKEQMVEETGIVIAFGPTCYSGWHGCDVEGKEPHECWGVNVGDKVEFRKYEGKESYVDGYQNHRYIPDTHIIGVISDE